MKPVQIGWGFVVANVCVWAAMVAILVVLPDSIARWLPLEVSRVIGWAVACTVWVVTVEQQWKVRYGPLTRILAQFILWVTAALFALWLSDQTHVGL